MKNTFILILFFISLSLSLMAEDITGFWQTINKETNKPSSVIAFYSYQGKYYGRIIATYSAEGKLDDTMYHPKGKAPGLVGNPHFSGLDIVWVDPPKSEDGKYKGYVINPVNGKIYSAKVWKEEDSVIMRGELFIFGRNDTWPKFPEESFNDDFKKPDLTKFVPNIPQRLDY